MVDRDVRPIALVPIHDPELRPLPLPVGDVPPGPHQRVAVPAGGRAHDLPVNDQIDAGLARMMAASDEEVDAAASDRERRGEQSPRGSRPGPSRRDQPLAEIPGEGPPARVRPGPEGVPLGRPSCIVRGLEIGEDLAGQPGPGGEKGMLHGIDPEPRPVEVAHEELGLVRPHPADEDPLLFRPVAVQWQPEEVGHFPQLVASADRAELAEERPRLEVARSVEVDLPLDRERDRHDPSPRGLVPEDVGVAERRAADVQHRVAGEVLERFAVEARGQALRLPPRGAMIGRVDRDQGGLAVTPHPAGVGLVDDRRCPCNT